VAAPSLVAVSFVEASLAGNANETTPTSITWQANDTVAVMVGTEGAGSETWTAPTTTGAGLTFAQQQQHTSASNCGAGLWTAVAASGSSGTFTIKNPSSVASTRVALAVFVWRGSAGVGASAQSATSTRTLALTPTGGADASILWAVFDWAAAAAQTATPTATTHSTAAPGPQASPQALLVTGKYTYYIEELDDQVSTGAVSYGIGGTGTGPFTIIALEVKAGGAVAAAIPSVFMAPMIGG
jgi:hypothetical protein